MVHVKMVFEIGGWCHSVDVVDVVDVVDEVDVVDQVDQWTSGPSGPVDDKCWDGFVHSAHLVRSPLEQEGRLPFGKRPMCGGMCSGERGSTQQRVLTQALP